MQRDFYPVPLIPPTIARIRNASIFTKFDVRQGYNNIRIWREDRHKAAFKTEFSIFVPNVMFFGLTNSPATFQHMMDSIFQHTIDKHHLLGTEILVYMDDILIASSSGLAGHRAAVHDVLAVLEEHDLYLKPKKCVWEADSVDYLGLILEKGVTHMDPTKVEGVRNWATPSTKKHVRSFLGFCNFYRAFIRGFAKLAKPLNNLTKKDTPWVWGNDEQSAFDTLKCRITEEPILRQPQMDKQFELEGGRVRLCHRHGPHAVTGGQQASSSGLLLSNSQRCGTELRHIRPRTPCSRQVSGELADLPSWVSSQRSLSLPIT
jgi:hypothetical protein